MLILGGLLVLSLLSDGGTPGGGCVSLDAGSFHAAVGRIVAARGPDQVSDATGDPKDYWATICAAGRKAVSTGVVLDAARLLRTPATRFAAASLLFDMDDRLSAARTPLLAAVRDQERRDHWLARRSAPLMPTSGNFLARALRCVLRKVETGRIDGVYAPRSSRTGKLEGLRAALKPSFPLGRPVLLDCAGVLDAP